MQTRHPRRKGTFNEQDREEAYGWLRAHPLTKEMYDDKKSELYRRYKMMEYNHRDKFGIGCSPDDLLSLALYVLDIQEDPSLERYEAWCNQHAKGMYAPNFTENPFKVEKIDKGEYALFVQGRDGIYSSIKVAQAEVGIDARNHRANWIADLVRSAPLL